jgi:hypothetical protein
MINFIDVRDGMILICEGLKCVGGGNDTEYVSASVSPCRVATLGNSVYSKAHRRGNPLGNWK